MSKQKFMGEYSINASRKMLFPYLSTASGLSLWFADDVNINNINKTLIFIVDGEGFWGCDRLWMLEEWIQKGGW